MPAPRDIHDLVKRFGDHIDTYKSKDYNETEVRIHFVNPFFKALGWDVDNTQRYEVVHETQVDVEEDGRKRPKHPDYGFRTGTTTRFFVETKKPIIHLKTHAPSAYQVRRYGWSAKLPVCVLTDFEEFSVYDCRIRPDKNDDPDKGRLRYYLYTDYVEKWDEIADLFSREAVINNALEEWVRGEKVRGTQEVDEAFLRELEEWRVMLAKDIALHNPNLTRRQINMAVQLTIDRIVFLRICEDRDIEAYGHLKGIEEREGIYEWLKQEFRKADARYNSGLFHFPKQGDPGQTDTFHIPSSGKPDNLTLGLTISDAPLRKILLNLYYPTSPYEFSVLPSDILGQVYERFLGKVIELSSSGAAEVVEKPEVRKAGGVYYTPTYIVDYIVEHTVGKLLAGKTPKQVEKLRILDPACGSGSFLIGAYGYLLDWHLDTYIQDNPQKYLKQNLIREHPDPAKPYALTTDEKKRILLNNIFGVDLDQQAVEVTKLSLLLKTLEGESAKTTQMELFATRVLPDLSDNIRWGNSLIGPDFYTKKEIGLFDEEALYEVNAFDWHSKTDGFGHIMAAGGFDAVIGNPPYIRIQTMQETAPETIPYYKQHYQAAEKGNYDIYVVFVEQGLNLLNKNGRLGYILPHKFFNAKYGEPLRGVIAQGKHLSHVVHFGAQQVFSGATTYTCMIFLDKAKRDSFEFIRVHNLDTWINAGDAETGNVTTQDVTANDWNFVIGKGGDLFDNLSNFSTTLGNIAKRMSQGIRTSANEVYVLDLIAQNGDIITAHSNRLSEEVKLERDAISLFLQGREIKPYQITPTQKIVIVPYQIDSRSAVLIPQEEMMANFPLTWDYFCKNKEYLEAREKGRFKGENWYVFGRNQNIDLMLLPKILVPDIANQASFALDEYGDYAFTSGYGITLKDNIQESIKYFLGLLNSKVLDFYLKQVSTTIRGGYFRYFTQYIEQLPIRTINFDDPHDVAKHDRMVELVEQMLDLHRQRAEASGVARDTIDKTIASIDREIDHLVYELYELTDKEINIVEGG